MSAKLPAEDLISPPWNKGTETPAHKQSQSEQRASGEGAQAASNLQKTAADCSFSRPRDAGAVKPTSPKLFLKMTPQRQAVLTAGFAIRLL